MKTNELIKAMRQALRGYHNWLLQNTDKHESLAGIDEYVGKEYEFRPHQGFPDSEPQPHKPEPVIAEPKEIDEGAAESGMDDRMGIVSGFEFPDSTVTSIDDDLIGAAASAYEKIACCEKDHPWLKEYVNEDFVAGAEWMQSEIIESHNSDSDGKRKFSDDEIEKMAEEEYPHHTCNTPEQISIMVDKREPFVEGFKAALKELELTIKTD